MRALWAAMVAVALAGCAADNNRDGVSDGQKDPTKVVEQTPSTPGGSLSGQVLGSDMNGLEGASVTITLPTDAAQASGITSELTATTDARGYWAALGIPANTTVLVTLTKTGYTTLRTQAFVPGQVATQPLSNGNGFVGRWILAQTNGSVKFQVLTASGTPAKGAHATLNVTPTAFVFGNFDMIPTDGNSALVAETTADDNGILTFSNVPSPDELYRIAPILGDANYHVAVSPLDENADGVIDSGGVTADYSPSTLYLAQASTTLRMTDARAGSLPSFGLLSTNVGSFTSANAPSDNFVKPGDPLLFVFSHAIQAPSLSLRVTDETGVQVMAMGAPTIAGGQAVSFLPQAPFVAGKEYNLALHAVSAETGEVLNLVGYFFGGDPASALAPDVAAISFHDTGNGAGGAPDGMLNPGELVEVTFNQPMGFYGSLASALPPALVFFGADLDGNGTTGNATGEQGYPGNGFELVSYEPVSDPGTQFRLARSGYTSRFLVNFLGPSKVPVGTQVSIAFDRITDSSTGLQGIWGQPLRRAVSKPLAQAAP